MEKDNNQNVVPSNTEPKDKEKTNETVPEFTPEQQDYIDRIVSGIKNENKQKLEEVTKELGKIIFGEKNLSSQAIGRAVSKNKLLVIVPCHRVIGSRGDLVGYAGGIDRKKYLLDHEK